MTIPNSFELANDSEFRLLANFTAPPRAGRITAIEASGQVRVATDDPDGGDVLAWPLNGFNYAVGDVVYIAFAANSPDTAIVLGAKAPLPSLDATVYSHDHDSDYATLAHNHDAAYVKQDGTTALDADWDIGEDRRIKAEALRARDSEGLRLEDDGANGYVHLLNGGEVELRRDSQGGLLNLGTYTLTESGNTFVTGFFRAGSDDAVTLTMVRDLATRAMMGAGVLGDTFRRVTILVDGTLQWGSGSATRDTNLYRSAAGVLKSDGSLSLDQASATGARPVLTLDQADVSEEFIEFVGTIATGNSIEAVGAKTLTVTHFIKVKLPGGLIRYLPVGTIA